MTLEIIKIMGFLSFCSKRFEFACRIFRMTIKETLRPYMTNRGRISGRIGMITSKKIISKASNETNACGKACRI
jgi:hypothetical protein